jgi:hypothetical protein
MAHTNVPQLPHSGFPQPFSQFTQEVHEALDAGPLVIKSCSYDSVESIPGACDGGWPCGDPVSEVIDGQGFCAPHARRMRLLASLDKLAVPRG